MVCLGRRPVDIEFAACRAVTAQVPQARRADCAVGLVTPVSAATAISSHIGRLETL
jgi:hypothetical protein